ncbi:serine/threonine protein kinase, partial [Streptomyces sp. NPDC005899]
AAGAVGAAGAAGAVAGAGGASSAPGARPAAGAGAAGDAVTPPPGTATGSGTSARTPSAPAVAPASSSAATGPGLGESTRERLRGALSSVRNAKTSVASAAGPGASPRPAGPPAQARASITDVVPRRTLAVIAGVVVLAVLGTVLAITLGDDGEGDQGGKGDGGTNASAGAASGGGADTGKGSGKDTGSEKTGGSGDEGDGAKGSQGGGEGQSSGSPSPTPGGEAPAKGTLPAGYKKVANKQFHFSVGMPESFTFDKIAGQNSGAIYNAGGGFPRLQVDYSPSPKDDAADAWKAAVSSVRGLSSGYKHIRIKPVEYNGYPTVADWEFSRVQDGMRVQVLNRGFKADASHGYSIMISCKQSEWDGAECRTLRETAFATFAPTD